MPCRNGTFQDTPGSAQCKLCSTHGYPAPCVQSYNLSMSARAVVLTLCFVSGWGLMGCFFFLLYFYNSRVVFHSAPPFLVALLLGAAVELTGVGVSALEMRGVLCSVKTCLMDLGLSVWIAALLCKV